MEPFHIQLAMKQMKTEEKWR